MLPSVYLLNFVTLTLIPQRSATTLALSNQNLALTATVASLTAGFPTGTVRFVQGQTLLGTAPVTNGTAAYTLSALPPANVPLTAPYSGDANFTQSSSPPLLTLSVTPASTSLTLAQTGSTTDALTITPIPGYAGTVQLSCTNLPQQATCSFQPSSLTFNGTSSSANVIMTVSTGVSQSATSRPPAPRNPLNMPAIPAAILWIPGSFAATLVARKRKIRSRSAFFLLIVLAGLSVAIGCSGSSSSSKTVVTPPGSSTIQVVAAGTGNISQTINVNLTVQ